MDFEYDPAKASANLKKHGVSFDEAESVLFDENAVTNEDIDHGETRYQIIGMSEKTRVLYVVFVDVLDDGELIRLISARKATTKEETYYGKRI
jgi:uncharacterized DUF497 family protein